MSSGRISAICAVIGVLIAAMAFYIQYIEHKRTSAPPPPPPPTAEELFRDGSDLKNHERYRDAIRVFTKALSQVRTETAAGQHLAALIQFSLGECYLKVGDCKEAGRYLALLGADPGGFSGLLKTEYDQAPCK